MELKNVLYDLCSCIESVYLQYVQNKIEKINSDYLSHLYLLNKPSNFEYKNEIISATIIGVSDIGKLQLKQIGGTIIECDVKEIIFL